MNAKQKSFILNKLIPFILRAEGNGFAMETWKTEVDAQYKEEIAGGVERFVFDGIEHQVPVCNTVACIGGSLQCLTRKSSTKSLAKILGLSTKQAGGLFYNWVDKSADNGEVIWPPRFRRRFAEKTTPLGKAKVVASLLKEVVRTNGACLKEIA